MLGLLPSLEILEFLEMDRITSFQELIQELNQGNFG